jgi:hypothetical protein
MAFHNQSLDAWHFDNISPDDIKVRAEREITLEAVLTQWTVSTDPKVHLNAIKELVNTGATHIVIHSGSQNQLKTINFYGREVLPTLRSDQLKVS